MIYLDTHVVMWLIDGAVENFSPNVAKLLDREPLAISPFVLLELKFLEEVGKIGGGIETLQRIIVNDLTISIEDRSLLELTSKALSYTWTRDPFDRMIVAQAASDGSKLITRDRNIRKHFKDASW